MSQKSNKKVEVIDLGIQLYKPTWDLQEQQLQKIVDLKKSNRAAQVAVPTPNYLYWVEHPPVIT